MAKKLQKQRHREVDYNRPNRKWLCGHTVCGKECPLGPSAGGSCRGSGECLPIRKGDRWYCTRPQSQGGECEKGPDPEGICGCPLSKCQPIRTHRYMRKLTVIGAAILSIGFIVVVLSAKSRERTVNPGTLSSVHAGENLSCDSCHSQGSLSSVTSLTDPDYVHSRALADSKLCLECHAGKVGDWESSARFAHSWNADERAKVVSDKVEKASFTETPLMVWLASKSNIREEGLAGEMACATCHQEHHGAEASLTKLSNNQCQVCHQEQFHSFNKGHPTFEEAAYPYSRRTRIFFDHESHLGKHFNKKQKFIDGYESEWPPANGKACKVCHEPDVKGEYMTLKSYDTTCAKCHDDKFVKEGFRMTFLAIPEVESEKVTGNWPQSGNGLLPVTRLLLAGETRDALRKLEESVSESSNERIEEEEEFGEVWLNDDSRRETADLVAADLQQLLYDTWSDGSDVLAKRLEENGFFAPGRMEAVAGLPAALFQQLLFPAQAATVSDIDFPALDVRTLNTKLAEKDRSIGLWPKSSAKLTPLMIELLSHRNLGYAMGRLTGKEEGGGISVGKDGSIALDDLSAASNAEIQAVEIVAWEIKSMFVDLDEKQAPFLKRLDSLGGGILDTDKDDDDIIERAFSSARKDPNFVAGVKQEVGRFRKGFDPPKVETAAETETASTTEAEKETATESGLFPVKAITSEDSWQEFGGWAFGRDSITYAAQVHADPVLKAWIEAAVTAANSDDAALRDDGFRVLNHTFDWKNGVESEGTGGCFLCHTVDRDPVSTRLTVNWHEAHATSAQANRKPNLTRFVHEKHVNSLTCLQCHKAKEDGEFGDFFPLAGKADKSIPGPEKFLPASSDPGEFSSNFLPMNEQTLCATCHQQNRAGNDCLQCHSYHTLDH